MSVDPALQSTVLAACQALSPPVLPLPPPDAAAHLAQALLLLPAGTDVDEMISAEMARLGVTTAIVPGEDGQSRLHAQASAAGHDPSQPILWIEEVTFDQIFRVLTERDLGMSAPVTLTETWADIGGPKLLTLPDPTPGMGLRVSVLLTGTAELQLLEDEFAVALSPAQHTGTGTMHDATVASERAAGQHVYRLQARGTGTIDAATLALVTSVLVPR